MKRASFTITVRNGIAYDANHLAITYLPALNTFGEISAVSFICSGRQMTIPAVDVESVNFHPAGATFCSECDRILQRIGSGIHE